MKLHLSWYHVVAWICVQRWLQIAEVASLAHLLLWVVGLVHVLDKVLVPITTALPWPLFMVKQLSPKLIHLFWVWRGNMLEDTILSLPILLILTFICLRVEVFGKVLISRVEFIEWSAVALSIALSMIAYSTSMLSIFVYFRCTIDLSYVVLGIGEWRIILHILIVGPTDVCWCARVHNIRIGRKILLWFLLTILL